MVNYKEIGLEFTLKNIEKYFLIAIINSIIIQETKQLYDNLNNKK